MGPRITVLAGGYGGAKLSHGLALASAARMARHRPALDLSIVVNTGDDLTLHGLEVSPDLDTMLYTLAGLANDETGWGVRDETWSGSAMLERLGAATWFRLGDRDLATNLLRTERLRSGQRRIMKIAEVTGLNDSVVTLRNIFEFRQLNVTNGQIDGDFPATGNIPNFMHRMQDMGIELPLSIFTPTK